MKFMIASALATFAGLGWAGFSPDAPITLADDAACAAVVCPLEACPIGDCASVKVEPLGNGTCRIECEGPDGSCWAIVECDDDGGCRVLEQGGAGMSADCARTVECEAKPDCSSRPNCAPAAAPIACGSGESCK